MHGIHSLRIHAKKGRINFDSLLIELLCELSIISWEGVCFSETRLQARAETIDGNHRLIASNTRNSRSAATGVAILLHRRCAGQVKSTTFLHNPVIVIDAKLSRRMVEIIVVYVLKYVYVYIYIYI